MSSCCPVCYKKVDFGLGCPPSKGGRDGSVQLRFFKLIQRYLEDAGDGGGVEKETCRKQFPFPLEDFQRIGMISCGECLKLMESFCSLYSQLMTVELYLNWKVQTVKNIMKAAQRVPSRKKNFQDYIIEKVEVDGSRWKSLEEVMDSVSQSRKALITKCSQKLEASFPKLCLKQWKTLPMEESVVDLPSVETSERTLDSTLTLSGNSTKRSEGPACPSKDIDEGNAVAKMEPGMESGTVPSHEAFSTGDDDNGSSNSSNKSDDIWDMNDTEMGTGNSYEDQAKDNYPEPLDLDLSNDVGNKQPSQLSTSSRKRKCTEQVNLTCDQFEAEDCDVDDDDDFNVSSQSSTSSEEEEKPKPTLRTRINETKLKETGTGIHRLKCPDCANLFQDVATLLLHRKNSDTSCGASYDPSKSIRVEVIQLSKDDNSSNPLSVVAVADLPQALFICEECDLAVYTPEDLEAHKKLHGTFPCKFCPVTVTFAPDLAKHELRHIKKGKRKPANNTRYFVYCSRCPTKWSPVGHASTRVYPAHHLKEHLSLTFKQHKCSICKTTRDRFFNLGQHFKKQHDLSTQQQRIVRCGVGQCDAYFLSKLQLRHHARMHHGLGDVETTGKEKRHKCKDCDRTYYQFKALQEHRLKHHLGPNPDKSEPLSFEHPKTASVVLTHATRESFRLKCPDCSLLFPDMRTILLHRKDSESCGALYDPSSSIRVEVLTPNNNEQEEDDEENSLTFDTVYALIDLPQEILLCELCDLAFYSAQDMEAHKKLHGLFHCQFCNVERGYAPELALHELTHSARAELKGRKISGAVICPRCRKTFDNQSYTQHHLQQHLSLILSKPLCAICKTVGVRIGKRHVLGHLKTHHDLGSAQGPEHLRTCPEKNCSAYFLTSLQLCFHLKYRHRRKEDRKLPKKDLERRREQHPIDEDGEHNDNNKPASSELDLQDDSGRNLGPALHTTFSSAEKLETHEQEVHHLCHMGEGDSNDTIGFR